MTINHSALTVSTANLEEKSFIWTVTAFSFDLTTSNVFYLWVQDAIYGGVFGSSYLNFTTNGQVQSLGFPTCCTSTSSPTQSPSTLPTISTVSEQATSTATPTAGSQSSVSSTAVAKSSSIGTGAIAGIAVVGAVLVIALIIGWFFWNRRRSLHRRDPGGEERVYSIAGVIVRWVE